MKRIKKVIVLAIIVCLNTVQLSMQTFAEQNDSNNFYEVTPERKLEAQTELNSHDLKSRFQQIDWTKASSYSEYDMLEQLSSESAARLSENGYTNEEISKIQNYHDLYVEQIEKLANIDEDQLRRLNYTDNQIYAIKNFDGSENMMKAASATALVVAEINRCRYDASTNRTTSEIYCGFEWDGVPVIKLTDMMVVGWDGWYQAARNGFVQYAYIYDGPDYIDIEPTYIDSESGMGYGGGYKFNAAIEDNYFYAQNGYCEFIVDSAGIRDMHVKGALAHQTLGFEPSFSVEISGSGGSPIISFEFINTEEIVSSSDSQRVKQ